MPLNFFQVYYLTIVLFKHQKLTKFHVDKPLGEVREREVKRDDPLKKTLGSHWSWCVSIC